MVWILMHYLSADTKSSLECFEMYRKYFGTRIKHGEKLKIKIVMCDTKTFVLVGNLGT